MTVGTITHAAVARPSGRLGPLAVEAPDEDGFTLAVAALEALENPVPTGRIERIDLVGDVPAHADWALGEALGIPGVPVHRTPGGAAHLFEALRSRPERPAYARLVVAVDLSNVGRDASGAAHGALAVAFRLAEGRGVAVDLVASHAHPPAALETPLHLEATATAPGAEPAPLLLLGDAPRVAAASQSVRNLGYAPVVVPNAPAGTGPAPTAPFALALRSIGPVEAARGAVSIAVLGAGRDVYVRASVSAPIAWTEAPAPAPLPLSAPPVADSPSRLDARAEGAYVPHARYLENLPSRWRLIAERCATCGALSFPARGVCRTCGATAELTRVPLAHRGWTVEATTTVRPGAQPTEFDEFAASAGAYDVVIARAPEGPRATFQAAGPAASVRIGDPIGLTLRRLYPMEGEWRYGRKAAVAKGASP
jgi:uncharacterized OB-fold protein